MEIRKLLPIIEDPMFTYVKRWPQANWDPQPGDFRHVYRMRRELLPNVKDMSLAGDYMGNPATTGSQMSGINAADGCAAYLSGQAAEQGGPEASVR